MTEPSTEKKPVSEFAIALALGSGIVTFIALMAVSSILLQYFGILPLPHIVDCGL